MSQFDKTNTDKLIENSIFSKKTECKPRTPGGMKGQIWISDDFDESMSEEECVMV